MRDLYAMNTTQQRKEERRDGGGRGDSSYRKFPPLSAMMHHPSLPIPPLVTLASRMPLPSHPEPWIKGLYGIADAGASNGDPERMLASLLEGGCRLIQFRCKGWGDDDALETARRMVTRCHAFGARLLLNDRAHLVDPASAMAYMSAKAMPTTQPSTLDWRASHHGAFDA